jgi:hypothetical protein
MPDFSSAAIDYLTTRRAMGYQFAYQGQMVGQFAAYLDGIGAKHLTIDHALAWATLPAGAAPVWWAVRLSTARGFARYLSALDPATEVPPVGLLPEPSHRATPYIYSPAKKCRSGAIASPRRPSFDVVVLARRSVCLDSSSTLNVGPGYAAVVDPEHEDGSPSGARHDRSEARTHSRIMAVMHS